MITPKRFKRMTQDDRISNFVDASIECGYAGRDYLTRQEIGDICATSGLVFPRWLAYNQGVDGGRQIGRAKFSFPELNGSVFVSVSPGHGNDGDDLADTTETHVPVTHVVTDDMGEHTVSDDVIQVMQPSMTIPTISAEDMLAMSNQ